MNKKECKWCGEVSFSSVGETQSWICPYCGNDLKNEPLKQPDKKNNGEKKRDITA